GPEESIFPVLEELGIGVTAYGVLSRGLLTGAQPAAQGDFRAHLPRFTGENGRDNANTIEQLNRVAAEAGLRASHLAIAWVYAKGSFIIPVIGARTRKQLYEALDAVPVKLAPDVLRKIDDILSASAIRGARYQEAQMAVLDSEK